MFGNRQLPASIGDVVWEDLNGDGVQDENEPGVEGVEVRLLDCSGQELGLTTTTDANGKYAFTDLAPGDYKVQFVRPDGYEFTTQGPTGTKDGTDSDIGTDGLTECITLAPGEDDLTWDAGLVVSSKVTKSQWSDESGDWTIDPLYGLGYGDTISYQIRVDDFYLDEELIVTDILDDFLDFAGNMSVQWLDGDTWTTVDASLYEFTSSAGGVEDNLEWSVSKDYISTLGYDDSLRFLFDTTVSDKDFGIEDPAAAITNTAVAKFGDRDPLESNTVVSYAVPEPGTVFLLGAGLLGMFGLRRKFRKR
jgi:hypothetical protein